MTNTHNETLSNLITAINHISLNHQDLMSASLEYYDIYFKNKKDKEKAFGRFWNEPAFIDLTVMAAREGVVLGMQAVTLTPEISFEDVVNGCLNISANHKHEQHITQNKEELAQIHDFHTSLRKEIFSRIFSGNKPLQKVSKIPKDLLQKRYDYFMNLSFS